MRRLMFITLMAALWAWGAAAEAAQYRVKWNVEGTFLVVDEPTCSAVAKAWSDRQNAIQYRAALPSGGGRVYWWWPGACSVSSGTGYTFRSVGDVMTISMYVATNEAGSYQRMSDNYVFSLDSIIEDSVLDDVSGIPIQRVLVLLGGALMLGLGVGVGRIR